jgi:hypothetical protein
MTMQQVLWNTNGRVTAYGTVLEKDVYISFFEKLSKSIYFEKYKNI